MKKSFLGIGVLMAMSSNLYGQEPCQISLKNLNQGIVQVRYKSPEGCRIKVIVQKGERSYSYNLNNEGLYETFPLQLGNGLYKVIIYENTVDNKYKPVAMKEFELQLLEEKQVYLNSVQNINWNSETEAIQLAKTFLQDDLKSGLNAIYEYIIEGYSYDYNKLKEVPTTYLPNINELMKQDRGICYDFSSLYAVMLRSQGIPTKLVMGYRKGIEGLHSWNEVYLSEDEGWYIIDLSYDIQLKENNQESPIFQDTSNYVKYKEY